MWCPPQSQEASPQFYRITFNFQDPPQKDAHLACKSINQAITLRNKYVFRKQREDWEDPIPAENEKPAEKKEEKYSIKLDYGVYKLQVNGEDLPSANGAGGNGKDNTPPSFLEFFADYVRMLEIANEGPVKTYSYWRLKILERKFQLHTKLNRNVEKEANRCDVKDWSIVMKVDTHVHLAAAMTRQHLLSFISAKATNFPNEVVLEQNGKKETLQEVLLRLKLPKQRLTIEALDVEAGSSTFQRFDEFNSKYNPFGFSELRTIFLKTSNYIQGRYMAELTKELFKISEDAQYHATEYRISVYGSKRNEWTLLAQWINDYKVRSPKNRWLIQVPRIYKTFFASGNVKTFQEMLDNIFLPLFEVTLDPSTDPNLFNFLLDVSGFDSVDDESKLERLDKTALIPPAEWNFPDNPPYAYYLYFMYANIFTLNRLREAKGLNTFDFRPHCGESGDTDNLSAGFLLAKNINHGINLQKTPPLQYLYYLGGVGLAVSPLSNNSLFLDYKRNPFYSFFERGLNVSLSTDDPLQFHHTQSPLVEEYVVASKRWKLNECDLSEIARNSVTQSGFDHEFKKQWLGKNYYMEGVRGNDISYTNVPNIRVMYRYETLQEEVQLLSQGGPIISPTRVPLPFDGNFPYNRVFVIPPNGDGVKYEEEDTALELLREALAIRKKYKTAFFVPNDGPPIDPPPTPKNMPHLHQGFKHFEIKPMDGIFNLFRTKTDVCSYDLSSPANVTCKECDACFCTECDRVLHKHPQKKFHHRLPLAAPIYKFPSIQEFHTDLRRLVTLVSNSGPLRTYCATRLEIIDNLFVFHTMLNDHVEHKARMDTAVPVDNTGQVRKVDNHQHLAGCMTAPVLLSFMRKKLKENRDDIVKTAADGNETLGQMFARLGIEEKYLTLDSLGVKADESVFHRFDSLNSKYRPFGSSDLQNLFLRRTNDMEGKYFAELVGEVFRNNEKLNVHTEIGISIYGRQQSDWDYLGWWIHNFKIDSPNNRWVVQVPRLYHLHKRNGEVENFQQMLAHIFVPLLETSRNPESHPYVADFLKKVSSFDIVDDEGQLEMNVMVNEPPAPAQWDTMDNPPYSYYAYYVFANMVVLNEYRKSMGLNTFTFRPHCGAAGDMSHLAAGFMFASNIVHGLNLRRSSIMQYLYYLEQIGITCSVVSEDSLYIAYEDNPFPNLFRRGLNVTLSTDNPLLLHFTSEPLSEEYAIAAQMWKLSECDLCEIARNSMLQTGFYPSTDPSALRKRRNSSFYGNSEHYTGVPTIRLCLREEILREEWQMVNNKVDLSLSSSGAFV